MSESIVKTATGAILYDQAIINQISDERFTSGGWPHAEQLNGELGSGGRGNTLLVGNVPRQFVLRRYQRGGAPARISRDRYFWAGPDKTRSFSEWRLLAKLADMGLRVPRPAAARYSRSGLFYTAELMTVRIPNIEPLSQRISRQDESIEFWRKLGTEIQFFHSRGVYHADMNAYNIQIDTDGDVWMLDFDRGRIRPPGSWQQQTLGRLHRSLLKLKTRHQALNFAGHNWDALLAAYFDASRSA